MDWGWGGGNKYPTKGSEGSDVAAGTGLPAKGLINDSSVVWGRFYSQLYSSSPQPRAHQKQITPLQIHSLEIKQGTSPGISFLGLKLG